MISTLHTADTIETTSRRKGVAKKKPKCITDYNTHMHSVDTADQYVLLPIHSLTLEAPVVLHYLKAPTAVKLTAVCFIAF